jgi:hypothetical protein
MGNFFRDTCQSPFFNINAMLSATFMIIVEFADRPIPAASTQDS